MTATLRELLTGIVDYAGLFPPAGLSMADAVRNYAGYRKGPDAWMLGRFVLPVGRLDEFEREAAQHDPDGWQLSVLGAADLRDTVERVGRFNERHESVIADTLEVKATTIEDVEGLRPLIPGSLDVYVEIPLDEDPTTLIEVIGRVECRAKMRTGSMSPDAFPNARQVTRFMARCTSLHVPYKATAGLHHPVRATHPVSYEPNAQRACMHGFLNVFLGAALLRDGVWDAAVAELLEEQDPRALFFTEEAAGWREYSVGTEGVEEARRLAVAFGSCSFREPVEDLERLHLL